ncbi:hypothetical protein DL96DRAFT_1620782 [Flagelloscypha sp. PMI_526]|nr:hypothetical protein DL96DRAFT_1620782 [Flagelloscypha sp. PMI_526]
MSSDGVVSIPNTPPTRDETAVIPPDVDQTVPPVFSARVHEHDNAHNYSKIATRLLGVPPYPSRGNGRRNFNYDSKYPTEDPPGEEASDNARVWMIYNDEAGLFDDDMLHGFRDTLDSLLVFAALFSGVVATLLQIMLLRANGNITAINSVARSMFNPDAATRSSADIAINALFFASLSLSLSTALFSILVKQWLTAYAAKIPGTPKDVALTRHLRFFGLQKWMLPELIGVLPLVLHSSLWIFAAGLLLFVWQLNIPVFCAAASILGAAFFLYSISLLVPPCIDGCPYHIPLLDAPIRYIIQNSWRALVYISGWAKYLLVWMARHPCQRAGYNVFLSGRPSTPTFQSRSWFPRSDFESWASPRPTNQCRAVVWLFEYSSNPTIRLAAAKSLAGILPMEDSDKYVTALWLRDNKVGKVLTESQQLVEVIWGQLSGISLPTSSTQLQSVVLHASQTYNPWIRAECALHSWSYSWMQTNTLQSQPAVLTHRHFEAVVVSTSMKRSRQSFIQYILDHEDVWNPKTASWSQHPLNWNQQHPDRLGTPMSYIAIERLSDIVKQVSKRCDINGSVAADDMLSFTPLTFAVTGGHLETVKSLVAAGADFNRGTRPLSLACQHGYMNIVHFLLAHPGVVENTGMEKFAFQSPLYRAIEAGNLEIIRLLLEKGVRVSLQHRDEIMDLVVNGRELWDLEEGIEERRQEVGNMLEGAWANKSSNDSPSPTIEIISI